VLTLAGAANAVASVGGVAEDIVRNVEIVYGGLAGDTLTGDGLANQLFGIDGDDTLRGGAGADVLDGGLGADTADFSDKVAAVVVTLNGAASVLVSVGGVNEDTLRSVESVIGGSASDTLTGDAAANTLQGQAGNDVLRGNAGSDALIGGLGVDLADYRDKTVAVTVTLDGSNTSNVLVGTAVEDTLSGIESVYGGSAGDVLTGDAESNLFRGGGGADVIDGGAGADAVDYRDKTTAVVLALNGAANAVVNIGGVNEDTVRNVEIVYGGTAGDTLTGDGLANQLYGLDGNDVLSGGLGSDLLVGGTGIDTADYRDRAAPVQVTLALAANANVMVGGVNEDILREVESVYGGSGADTLTGDAGANLFRGGLGADTLDGAGGIDSVDFRDKSVSVVLTLNGAAGAVAVVGGSPEDSVRNIEVVYGGTAADTLSGDALANQLYGGGGDDVLRGGGGADLLDGGIGLDTADFRDKTAAVVVTLNGAANATATVGGVAEDTLRNIEALAGGTAGDTLTGDGLANVLAGFTGADTLRGNAGADTFVYAFLSDSTTASAGRDTIADFSAAQFDKIDLRGIDAAAGGVDNAFTFIGAAAFANATPGQLRSTQIAANTWLVEGEVTGDTTADFAIVVVSTAALVGTDFLL
jgi:Ca2+-binding RTX toxin-like protein